jgi:glyoxylase-like metal-dependent hydrolase (beta-lactamase superfamily II)
MSETPAPATLSWRIGDVVVTRVVEGERSFPATDLFPAATAEGLERNAAWLRPHYVDDEGRLCMSVHALCVESRGRKIVVDTCIGNDRRIPAFPVLGENTPFLERMAEVGFGRDAVDTVVCTHLHFDHVGWHTMLVDGRWVPTFPRARYVICRDEWAHWSAAERAPHRSVMLDDTVRPIVDAGLADLVPGDHRITDEVTLELTPGHTPGHVAVRIESAGAQALITGDLAHHPVQWAETSWSSVVDTDPAQSVVTRRALLERYANTSTIIIGTHYPPPVAGLLVTDAQGSRLLPLGTD